MYKSNEAWLRGVVVGISNDEDIEEMPQRVYRCCLGIGIRSLLLNVEISLTINATRKRHTKDGSGKPSSTACHLRARVVRIK